MKTQTLAPEQGEGTRTVDRPTILIVEDEAITALDIRTRLERAEYTVVAISSSAEDALVQVDKTKPDLVLMDIRLSGDMDGIEAGEAIRASSGTPVVYLTAYADGETLQRAQSTEPYGYLLKPFEEKEIHTTIQMALYKHKMERKIRESEQWLSTTLTSIGDAVIATDAQGRIMFMNPIAESLVGWAQAEATGRDIEEVLTLVHTHTGLGIKNPVKNALDKNQTVTLPSDCILLSADGSRVPVDDSAAPMRDGAGKVIGAVMVFRDISERRRAQEALEEQTRALQARNRELDAFAHTVAHDLKNPLSLVLGFAEVLADDHATMPRGKVDDYMQLLQENSAKAVNIVDELLLLSEVRKQDVLRLPLDMGAIVASVERRLAHVLKEQGAELTYPESWPWALGHGPWIEEVWVNYVSNAIKHGGKPPLVELGATEMGETVRFWVRDNGPGIEKEDLPRLFSPFTRLDSVRAQGHGLGLSIVRRIMGKLDGRAGVESTQGPQSGSLFYFELPLADT